MTISISKEDIAKILKGAAVAGIGAAITYLAQNVGSLNFGIYTPVVTAVAAVLVNILRKTIKIG